MTDLSRTSASKRASLLQLLRDRGPRRHFAFPDQPFAERHARHAWHDASGKRSPAMPQDSPVSETITARCCIVGGGPAGMMCGFLLARAGIDVVVLEKHADFLRDFRGDTVHPSTLELIYELGVLEDFLRRPHQELSQIGAQVDDFVVTVGDFSHLPTHCKFVGLMPQWEFLNFIAEKAKAYPGFHLRLETETTDLLIEDGKVAGVRARSQNGPLHVRAGLTIGAD